MIGRPGVCGVLGMTHLVLMLSGIGALRMARARHNGGHDRLVRASRGVTILALPTSMPALLLGAGAMAETRGSDTAVGDNREVYEYVGTKKCRMCHTPQYESWSASPKARSWEALKPGNSDDVKKRAGLDVHHDYTTEHQCLRCHSVGFGRPGGYVVPAPTDAKGQRMAAQREGTGCESCHGPGSGYIQVMRNILRNHRQYDPSEVRAAGRQAVTRATCQSCHNSDAICMTGATTGSQGTVDDAWLHVDVGDRHGFHERFPLEFRKADPPVAPGTAERGSIPQQQELWHERKDQ